MIRVIIISIILFSVAGCEKNCDFEVSDEDRPKMTEIFLECLKLGKIQGLSTAEEDSAVLVTACNNAAISHVAKRVCDEN